MPRMRLVGSMRYETLKLSGKKETGIWVFTNRCQGGRKRGEGE